MLAICKASGQAFTVSDREVAYCQRSDLPLPVLCPSERQKRMLAFRNRVHLYEAVCAFTKKPILSCIPPENGYTVCDIEVWNADNWDPLNYGQDYDFNKSFFEQLNELIHRVPLPNLTNIQSGVENSKYVNGVVSARNCYLCFAMPKGEDCLFSWGLSGKNLVDVVSCFESELCYDCKDVHNSYNVRFSESCFHCSDSDFLFNCRSCKDCFGCVNLSNKEYHWYNEQLTKEEFGKRKSEFNSGSIKVVEEEKKKFVEFRKSFPMKYMCGQNNENSSGNYLYNNKNAENCYYMSEAQDVENCITALKVKDGFCAVFCLGGELIYNSQTGSGNYHISYCTECSQNVRDAMFCLYCLHGCMDCFGCVSLKKKQYCILNKQYTREEYFKLVGKIKKQLWESGEFEDFFPPTLSPFYYNCSDAMSFFPLTRESALTQGFTWKDENIPAWESGYTIPDDIKDVSDDILSQLLKCSLTNKKYRITKQELDFYRRLNLPIPRVAPLERILERGRFYEMKELKTINCGECNNSLQSVYNSEQQRVLCESCYLKDNY